MTMPTLAYRSVDPATGTVSDTFDPIEDHVLDSTIGTADAAYRTWRTTDLSERLAAARRIAAHFETRAHYLAALARTEMGKPVDEGVEEAQYAAAIFRYYADHGEVLLQDQPLPTESAGTAVIQRTPIGVLLGIMPWNFPYYQVARFVAPNLVLGNTMLLKHAEAVPHCALAIAQLFTDADIPEGLYTNVFATHTQIETIIADPRVQGVSLTGSERAGAAVASTAGRELKKCVLELGGSDPFIVLDYDDVDSIADSAWKFRLYNNGQACNSNKRLIVHSSIAEEFVQAIVRRSRDIDINKWRPLASRKAAEDLFATIQDALSQGAILHAGGELADSPAAVLTPAVLTGVTPSMRAYHEELFGPVLVIYTVDDDDAAVALANDTRFGLGGSVFSTDIERARTLASRLDCGMANVNTPAGEGAELPFGGTKRSGFGRELGPLGLDEFANKRLLFVAS
ncbi:MAG: succinate-semialdehyde dehydrogenase [Gordonia sp.]|nr:succinate-semialdehyde dehydrogenase [Gordonia sp. (in: high G+C Gram-positive bacteria)]